MDSTFSYWRFTNKTKEDPLSGLTASGGRRRASANSIARGKRPLALVLLVAAHHRRDLLNNITYIT